MRLLGKVLFVLYIGFIIYFLLFSDLYGRTGVMEEYRYNLVLFKEIKRFWQYREQLGWYAMTKVGSFDVDDLLLNTIGGVAGYIIFVICAAVRRRHVRLSTRKRR